MNVEIKVYKKLETQLLDVVCELENAIFDEPYSRQKLEREFSAKHNILALVAVVESKPVAYKIGYEMTARIFYSWMGGVMPEFRGRGIALQLMDRQHAWARENGYRVVRTYTENKYRDMLVLNIRAGFDIVGVINEAGQSKTVIVLDKNIIEG